MSHVGVWPVLTLVGPLVALAAIWLPLLEHYYTPEPHIDSGILAAARQSVQPKIQSYLDKSSDGVPVAAPEGEAGTKADRLIESGQLQLGAFLPQSVELPFDPVNLEQGSVSWRLQIASLVVPHLFLDAYRETGDWGYLKRAKDAVLAWARFEKNQWLPQALLWNDHAVAARIRVLAQLWQAYREHPKLLEFSEAREVLAFAARSLKLTAKPSFYNPRTNHGFFQDLALWLGHLAFPGLPAGEQAADVAYKRFQGHLPYYLNREGVVLEHSAGYHRVGLSLLGRAFWFMRLSGQPIKGGWWRRYRSGVRFYRYLSRPDGTLPRLGDTHPKPGSLSVASDMAEGGIRLTSLEDIAPPSQLGFFPVAGYAVTWRGLGGDAREGTEKSQTLLAWSCFPMAGHKHADELSLHFWADGQDWWTAVGYWPYGHPGRERAEGWNGSNAPHYAGEAAGSERHTKLLGQVAREQGVRFFDLQRKGPDYRARRQLLSLPNNIWAVLDTAYHGEGQLTREVWRTEPEVAVDYLGPGSFRLRGPKPEQRLRAWFGGAGRVTVMQGEADKGIAGMLVNEQQPVATTSLVLRRPSEGRPSLVVWRRSGGSGKPQLLDWEDPKRWRLRLPGKRGMWEVVRKRKRLSIVAPSDSASEAVIEGGPAVEEHHEEILHAFNAMKAEYGGFRSVVAYRIKTTWLTGVLFLVHLVGLVVLTFFLGSRRWASYAVLIGWAAYVLWLRLYYFAL